MSTHRLATLASLGHSVRYVLDAEALETTYFGFNNSDEYPAEGLVPLVIIGGTRGVDVYDQSPTWERANHTALLRDFPGEFVTYSYANVDYLACFPDMLNDAAFDAVAGLSDYPVHDKEALTEIDQEIWESWEQYLLWDVSGMLTDDMCDMARELDSDELRDAFWTECQRYDYYPEHTGLDVMWDYDECAVFLASAIRTVSGTTEEI